MPKASRVANRTLSREEQRFIGRFVKLGGNPEKVSECERLSKIKHGEGAKMLKRAHVAEEIKRRLQPLHLEHLRQEVLADAIAAVTAKLAADKLKAEQEAAAAAAEVKDLIEAPRMAVNVQDLEHELMRLVKHLNMELHPQVKLAAIQAAFVVSGILENGNVRRVAPKDPGDSTFNNVIYGDLFDKMHTLREQGPQSTQTIEAEPEIFDLMPHQQLPAGVELPRPGEEIESIAGEPEPDPPLTAPVPKASKKLREAVRALTTPKVMTVDLG